MPPSIPVEPGSGNVDMPGSPVTAPKGVDDMDVEPEDGLVLPPNTDGMDLTAMVDACILQERERERRE